MTIKRGNRTYKNKEAYHNMLRGYFGRMYAKKGRTRRIKTQKVVNARKITIKRKNIAVTQTKAIPIPERQLALIAEAEQGKTTRKEPVVTKKQEIKKQEILWLGYNHYKGSGKCWVAEVNPQTKKIETFLKTEGVDKRDNYSGTKSFSVPLINGKMYLVNESGSKKTDRRKYYRVIDNQLQEV